MFTIILDDGTEIEANLNMNTWEADVEPDGEIFVNNTNHVSYITPDGDEIEIGECKFIKGVKNPEGKYLFFLNPLTDADRLAKQRSDIDFIAMMSDIDLEEV